MSWFLIILLLFVGAGIALAVLRLNEGVSEEHALSDRIGWCTLVAPGVMMQKDGSFFVCWRFQGPDRTAATPLDLNLLSAHLNRALLPFTDEWMHHVDLGRRPATEYAPRGHFQDPVSRHLDDQRRKSFTAGTAKHTSEGVWTATWLPPRGLQAKFASFLIKGDKDAVREGEWRRHLGRYLEAVSILEDRLSTRLGLKRMTSSELISHLGYCMTGMDLPLLPPGEGVPLDCFLSPGRLVGGRAPYLEGVGRYSQLPFRVVTWDGFPKEGTPAYLDSLLHLPFSYRWSTRFIPLGMRAAEKTIAGMQLSWFNKRKGAGQVVREATRKQEKTQQQVEDDAVFENSHARLMALGGKEAMAENLSGTVRFGHYDGCIVIHDLTHAGAEEKAAAVVKHMHNLGFNAFIERDNAPPAFLGTLPGNGSDNIRKPLLSSRNVVDLLPTTSVWAGLAKIPSPLFAPDSPAVMWTDGVVIGEQGGLTGATPFRFNPYNGDVAHTLVFGATGSGKSTKLGAISAQFLRYENAQVFGFDKGDSQWLLCEALGGVYNSLQPGDEDSSYQPLGRLDQPGEIAWATEWLETAVVLQGQPMDTQKRVALREAVTMVAGMEPRSRTMTALLYQLQDDTLRQALEVYTQRGPYGKIFDAKEEKQPRARFEVTELHWVMNIGPKLSVPVLMYLLHRLESRFDRAKPTLLWVDEAWMALMHSLFGPKLGEYLVTLRKYNVWVLLAMQSISQLMEIQDVRLRQMILESCPTQIFLANKDAKKEHLAQQYRAVGLNDAEIGLISEATAKRHYYFKNQYGSRMYDMRLTAAELAFYTPRGGMDMHEMQTHVQSLSAVHGERWPAEWLTEAGLTTEAAEFLSILGEIHDSVAA